MQVKSAITTLWVNRSTSYSEANMTRVPKGGPKMDAISMSVA